MIVDALGNPLALSLTGGQVHDIKQAEALLALVEPDALLGDKGYDADSFIDHLIARDQGGDTPEIKSKGQTRLRFRALSRTQSRRALLLHYQAFSGDRDTLREDRAKLPRRAAFGLRYRLAQMTTGPRGDF